MVRHTGEDFVDIEGITVAPMLWFQSSGADGAEFDAPEADRFPGDDDATLSQEVFDVAVAQFESVIGPDSIGNDIGWGAPRRNLWRL